MVIGRAPAFLRYVQAPFFLTPTMLMRRSVFEAVGGYDESLRVCEDLDLSLKLLQICGMGFINAPLYFYRRGRMASLSSTRRKTCAAIIYVLGRLERSAGVSVPEVRRILNERVAGKHALLAAFLIQEHDMQRAREHLAAAARRHPSPVTWARLALAKAGPLGYPILSWMAHRRLGDEPGGSEGSPERPSTGVRNQG